VFYDNKDGSKKVYARVAVKDDIRPDTCQFIHVEQYLAAGLGEGPWKNLCKGCRAQFLGHLESGTYRRKDGEVVGRAVVVVDSINYLETKAQGAARRAANAAVAAERER